MANLTKIAAGFLIAAAVLLGIFAWTLARRPVHPPVVQPVSTAALTPVVIATRALPAGQPIPADALRVQPLPIHPADAFSNTALVAGRVPVMAIDAESPVLDSELSSSLATSIEPGERAVAVNVNELNAVGDQIRPGNFVDVFFTLRRDGTIGGEVGRTQTRLLLSKARVLVFGDPGDPDAAQPRTVGNMRTSRLGTQRGGPRTAVLAVPVAQVDTLTLAQSQGQLMLALRNPTDDDVVGPSALAPWPGVIKVAAQDTSQSARAAEGVALDQLAGGSAPHPAQRQTVVHRAAVSGGALEVIRGGRVQTVAW